VLRGCAHDWSWAVPNLLVRGHNAYRGQSFRFCILCISHPSFLLHFHATNKDALLGREGCCCILLSCFILIPACCSNPFNGYHDELAQTFFRSPLSVWNLCTTVGMRGTEVPKNNKIFSTFCVYFSALNPSSAWLSAFYVHTHE
jgi:hypothetical protein